MSALLVRALRDRDTVLCWTAFTILFVAVMAVPA